MYIASCSHSSHRSNCAVSVYTAVLSPCINYAFLLTITAGKESAGLVDNLTTVGETIKTSTINEVDNREPSYAGKL